MNGKFIFKLPPWAYITLSAFCAAAGVWASEVTYRNFVHGAEALESDPALQALAKSAALLLVVLGMAAFALAAILDEAELKARKVALSALAGFIVTLEMVTIGAFQSALVVGAGMSQSAVIGDVASLERQIAQNEKQSENHLATAASLRANDQLKWARVSEEKAAAEKAKNDSLYKQLSEARKAKRPTLSGMMGEGWAMIYVVVRGSLVSFCGMVFLGVGGAMLRIGLHGSNNGGVIFNQRKKPVLPQAPLDAPPRILRYPRRETGRVNLHETAPDDDAPDAAHEEIAPITPAQVQKEQKTKDAKVRTVPAGLRAAIESGECKPSQGAVRDFAGGGWPLAKERLRLLEMEGVLESNGQGGYRLKRKQ